MRKHRRRRSRSNNGMLRTAGYKTQLARFRHLFDNMGHGDVTLSRADRAASREGDAIIRRGKSASTNKAWHDSILWNSNVRKVWIRRMLELSDAAERFSIFRLTEGSL